MKTMKYNGSQTKFNGIKFEFEENCYFEYMNDSLEFVSYGLWSSDYTEAFLKKKEIEVVTPLLDRPITMQIKEFKIDFKVGEFAEYKVILK